MKRLMLLLLLLPCIAKAQVQPAPYLPVQYLDNNGRPLAGGCLFTAAAGTNTPLATFKDYLGTILNSNPVILDSAGRAYIFLSSSSYRFTLKTAGGTNCSSGVQLWTVDGVNPSANSILASNNVWTGTNTWQAASVFNGTVNFTSGFTSSGPANLNGGGAMLGSWTGSPTFTGTPNFSGGFMATTGTFSGQITSTVAPGTPPFVVASQTEVTNLNANYLEGCDWPSPCPLGAVAPSSIDGTTINAHTAFAINGSTPQTDIVGTDTTLLSAGTVTGLGKTLCVDAQGGAGTGGCITANLTQIESMSYCASGCDVTGTPCTTGNNSYDDCTDTLTWPQPFVDTDYTVTCNGEGPVDPAHGPGTFGRVVLNGISTKTNTTVTVITSTQGSVPVSWTRINCQGIHNALE